MQDAPKSGPEPNNFSYSPRCQVLGSLAEDVKDQRPNTVSRFAHSGLKDSPVVVVTEHRHKLNHRSVCFESLKRVGMLDAKCLAQVERELRTALLHAQS